MGEPRGEILFVTDRRFWRRSIGSEQRIASLVRFLCRQDRRVAVVYLGRLDRGERRRLATFAAECPGLAVIDRSLRHGASPLDGILARWRGPAPSVAGRRSSPARRAFVARVIARRRPTVVVIEFLRLANLIVTQPNVRAQGFRSEPARVPLYLVDTHDLLHERAQRAHSFGLAPEHEIDATQEAQALALFDVVVAIQEREGEAMRRLVPGRPVIVVPHGIEMPAIPAPGPGTAGRAGVADRADATGAAGAAGAAREPLRLGFLGGRDDSNRQSLDWFVEHVWPDLRSSLGPSIELHVAGQICSAWHPGAVEGVEIRGRVDSIDAFWTSIDVAINPVRHGSGLKIKNVEALAYGRPLLTTTIGAEGLEAASPDGLRIADTPESWLETLRDWANDAASREATGRLGRAWASEHLCEQAAFAPLLRLLEEQGR